jgi:hypothetical protein
MGNYHSRTHTSHSPPLLSSHDLTTYDPPDPFHPIRRPADPRRTHHARRDVHRAARTRVRVKDLDQIQDDMTPLSRAKLEKQPIDEDKPGLGQHVSGHEMRDMRRGRGGDVVNSSLGGAGGVEDFAEEGDDEWGFEAWYHLGRGLALTRWIVAITSGGVNDVEVDGMGDSKVKQRRSGGVMGQSDEDWFGRRVEGAITSDASSSVPGPSA